MDVLGSPREAPWPPRDPPGVGVVQATVRDPEGGGPLRRLQKPCQTALGILARLNAQARWRISLRAWLRRAAISLWYSPVVFVYGRGSAER